jgi:receptor expression-enhancing protein 1/2/3/4
LLYLSLPQFEARAIFYFFFEIKSLILARSYIHTRCLQGSTYVYKAYVEPYLVQNESDIDASIASARDETLRFVQSRLVALWDILYSLLSKTPVTPKPKHSPTCPPNGSPLVGQGAAAALFQSMQDLWAAIGAPSFSVPPALDGGKPALSRLTSDTRASEMRAPSPAAPVGASNTVGYDVGEVTNN